MATRVIPKEGERLHRITIGLPTCVYQSLIRKAEKEDRSLSYLAVRYVESGLAKTKPHARAH
jgi:hypothetical protein